MTKNTIKIVVFGQLAELLGADQLTAPLPENTEQLKTWLQLQYPALNNKAYIIAVNKKIQAGNIPLGTDMEIALLPPFSGG